MRLTLDQIREYHPHKVEKKARYLFANESECTKDRAEYVSFDAMPENLKEWWRFRAARRILEVEY